MDTSFCMESGQVQVGNGAQDTFIKMLQEMTRITALMQHTGQPGETGQTGNRGPRGVTARVTKRRRGGGEGRTAEKKPRPEPGFEGQQGRRCYWTVPFRLTPEKPE